MNPEIYEQIKTKADPIITSYRDDLLKHDREFLDQAPDDLPFLHYTRDSGTHIVALHPALHLDEIFHESELIRYLFGTVTRPQFIQKKLEEHEGIMSTFGSRIELILYYGPQTGLEPVSESQALAVVQDYIKSVK
jgi:hypothetical protein